MSNIKITYKDKEVEYEKGTSLLDISKNFKDDYKKDIIVASIDNRLTGLDTKVTKSSKVMFYDSTSVLGNRTYLRGIYFLLSKAVKDVLNCDVKIMHTLDKGIYCEILTNNLISEVTTEKIKIRMKELSAEALPITKIMVSRLEAIEYFSKINQKDKAASLRFISNSTISLYKLDDCLDYFYDVLPCNTKYLTSYNLKYLKDNKMILLAPTCYNKEDNLKFERNESFIRAIERNDKLLESLKINTSVELNNTISTGDYGDIIRISESIQNNKLFEIVDSITKNKDIKIVLITGASSSGKTTTSKKLTLFFGKSVL